MKRRKLLIGIPAAVVALLALLSIPSCDPAPPRGAGGRPFAWKQDEKWKALEAAFLEARKTGPGGLRATVDEGLRRARQILESLSAPASSPDAPLFDELEKEIFSLGTRVAVCTEMMTEYADLVTRTRGLLKRQSQGWDMDSRAVRDRLYRLLYGGRAALEEALLQAPPGACPALIRAEPVPSATPSCAFSEGTLRSGDILVSRGGAPTSALIARGNDYPGNFSHIALLHVDEKTGAPVVVEAHIESGLGVTTPEAYLRDKKLRIMVLRLRPDLPAMKADPMLPHRAAQGALEMARSRRVPYDFAMDCRDPSRLFCSEVASSAYRRCGVELWKGTTSMSSPGIVRWLSCFGVAHFETQAPADLEYDPQVAVVAEWRDPETLWQDHVDGAVIEAMLEGADEGDVIPYPRHKLALARLAKGWSVLLNVFGGTGPVPEGMSATTALRHQALSARHERLKERVLLQAAAFREREGYRPPYWELVRMANAVRKGKGEPK